MYPELRPEQVEAVAAALCEVCAGS
jgi:hypothetical protein